jgi:hypothetical protein
VKKVQFLVTLPLACVALFGFLHRGRTEAATVFDPGAWPLPAADTTRLEIWFVFRSTDCKLSADLIRHLNDLSGRHSIMVAGVMLDAARLETPSTLAADLGVRFPLTGDGQRWAETLQNAQMPNPVLILRDRGRLLGVTSPAFLRRYGQITAPAASSDVGETSDTVRR